MLNNFLSRFNHREALIATAAQAAVTWGSNHLAATVASLGEDRDQLRRLLEEAQTERDALALERDALAEKVEFLRAHWNEAQPAAYPTSEDVAPLTVAVEHDPRCRPGRSGCVIECPLDAVHLVDSLPEA